jgi:predicted ATPase
MTSQTPLNIDGEHIYGVRRMDSPDATDDARVLARLDAFQLFRERARARIPDWDVQSSAEAAAVAEILRLVEGVPLSIELAAAWVSSQTLNEIVTGLSKRLSLLKRRGAGGSARHASMTACLDYSFGLLSGEAKELFPKLAVFTSGFFAEDVAVCGTPSASSVLISLHERSLLVRQEILGRTRYSMLATVQEFAGDELLQSSAAEPLKRDHAQYFPKVLGSADRQLGGRDYAAALERIAADFGNFEAGMRESQNRGKHRAVMDYASHLADYLRINGRFSDRLKLMLAARAAAAKLDASSIARADNNLGNAYARLPTGDRGENLKRAIECYEAALRVRTERDFPQDWAGIQNNLGSAYADLPTGDRGENLKRAIECYEAALRV